MQIQIRALSQPVGGRLREYVERRLLFALGRFGGRVQRVLVRLEDLNGPRGGLDKRCQMEVRLAGRGVLVVDVRDSATEPAVSRAADRMARRVREELAARREARRRPRLAPQASSEGNEALLGGFARMPER